jgi:hypothetical protein
LASITPWGEVIIARLVIQPDIKDTKINSVNIFANLRIIHLTQS